jgi:peptide/nickel transport system permease protein
VERTIPGGASVFQTESLHPSSRWRDFVHSLLQNKGAVIGLCLLALLILAAIFAPLITRYDPIKINPIDRTQPPSREHWLGTDQFGRDIYTRIVYGARISLPVGLIAVSIAAVTGGILGLIAGYLIAVGVGEIPRYTRLIRSSVLSAREHLYVDAARVVGVPTPKLLFRHILPNVVGPVVVLSTLSVGSAILAAAGLSFLGLGSQPPDPEWGTMLADGRQFLRSHWWVSTMPGVAIALTVLAVNMAGDGLRDILDPRLRV